jgi:hypothetical protein
LGMKCTMVFSRVVTAARCPDRIQPMTRMSMAPIRAGMNDRKMSRAVVSETSTASPQLWIVGATGIERPP